MVKTNKVQVVCLDVDVEVNVEVEVEKDRGTLYPARSFFLQT